ncbi:hypothetical protein EDC01DRAFT_628258 [Geopyxis carbonaria]|nr:hypothetical protein EDC01DRAFT_628258 [Geopyxis carbonaria]
MSIPIIATSSIDLSTQFQLKSNINVTFNMRHSRDLPLNVTSLEEPLASTLEVTTYLLILLGGLVFIACLSGVVWAILAENRLPRLAPLINDIDDEERGYAAPLIDEAENEHPNRKIVIIEPMVGPTVVLQKTWPKKDPGEQFGAVAYEEVLTEEGQNEEIENNEDVGDDELEEDEGSIQMCFE